MLVESLSRLAVPLVHHGPIVIAGFGEVGRQVQEMLTTAGEKTVTIGKSGEEITIVMQRQPDSEKRPAK